MTRHATPGINRSASLPASRSTLATTAAVPAGVVGTASPVVATVSIPPDDSGRLLLAAYRAMPYLPADLRDEVAALLTPKAMAVMAGAAVVLAGSQFILAGEVFDVLVGGLTYATIGWQGIKALRGFATFYQLAVTAKTDADIDAAARAFASATLSTAAAIGFAGLGRWLNRPGSGVVIAETDAAKLARWTNFIESMKFKVPPDQGMLFSKLTSDEEAIQLAKEHGLTCLLQASDEFSFRKLYTQEFGDEQSWLTKKIWEMISERFAQSLEGKVTAFVDRAKFYDSLNTNAANMAARDGTSATASALHELKKLPYARATPDTFDPNIREPVFLLEDETLSKLLLSNPKITELQVIDIKTGETFGYRTPELQRWFQSHPQR